MSKKPSKAKNLIEEIEEFLAILPAAEEGSLEDQFRESVKLLVSAIKHNPRDDNGQFVAPSFLGS